MKLTTRIKSISLISTLLLSGCFSYVKNTGSGFDVTEHTSVTPNQAVMILYTDYETEEALGFLVEQNGEDLPTLFPGTFIRSVTAPGNIELNIHRVYTAGLMAALSEDIHDNNNNLFRYNNLMSANKFEIRAGEVTYIRLRLEPSGHYVQCGRSEDNEVRICRLDYLKNVLEVVSEGEATAQLIGMKENRYESN